jgi:hypothetical protein
MAYAAALDIKAGQDCYSEAMSGSLDCGLQLLLRASMRRDFPFDDTKTVEVFIDRIQCLTKMSKEEALDSDTRLRLAPFYNRLRRAVMKQPPSDTLFNLPLSLVRALSRLMYK